MIITAGKFKGRKIAAPGGTITRPTLSKVRMGVFNTLQSMIDFEGKSFLDMYAGSGIMGLEALSRGFEKITFVEKMPKTLKENLSTFNFPFSIYQGDSLKIVPKLGEFDVAYIDPPYCANIYPQSLAVVRAKIIIVEHVEPIEHDSIIKQKKYGDKLITFIAQ
jgi:16S rRNA (guanine966-N2)-methyltransferase